MSAGGPSDVPVMTKTFSATLVATELLLLELLGRAAGRRRSSAAIVRAADHAEAAIADGRAARRRASPRELADAEHLFVVGSGLAHVAALEAALKLKEMAIVHAEGTETWEMASGAATIVGPDERRHRARARRARVATPSPTSSRMPPSGAPERSRSGRRRSRPAHAAAALRRTPSRTTRR